jgi:HSP20 family molecular chaperone IbpA
MEGFIDRIKNAFEKTVDRAAGRHVPVRGERAPIENLEDRPLSTPAVDIYENDSEFLVRADAPGATTDNTFVHWDERQGLAFYVRSAAGLDAGTASGDGESTDWYRAIPFPDYVDGSRTRAAVRNGVLTIHLPKREIPAPARIPVKVAR